MTPSDVQLLREEMQQLTGVVQKVGNRAIVFIDNTNLSFTIKKIDNGKYRLNYQKLVNYLAAGRLLKQVRFYCSDYVGTALPSEEFNRRQERENFYNALRHFGFWLKICPLVERSDGSMKEKGLDAAIVRDIERVSANGGCDTVILVAGDADYKEEIADIATLYGMRAEVAFFPEYASKQLIQTATEFIDLSKAKEELRRV